MASLAEGWVLPPFLMAKQRFAPELLSPRETGGRSPAPGGQHAADKCGVSGQSWWA